MSKYLLIGLFLLAGCYSGTPEIVYVPVPQQEAVGNIPPSYDCTNWGYQTNCTPQGGYVGAAPNYKCVDWGYKIECSPY